MTAKKTIILLVSTACIAALIWFGTFFHVFLIKKQLTLDEATVLAESYLVMAANEQEAFMEKRYMPLTSLQPSRDNLSEHPFKNPHSIKVERVKNSVIYSGYDDKSLTELSGSYYCEGLETENKFWMTLIYNSEKEEWGIMKLDETGCK